MDFSPSVYEHAATLIHRSPWDVSRDAELMFQAHAAAYRLYRHRPIVVGIDIYNLEAEAYGGVIRRPQGDGIPAVTEPLFRSVRELCQMPLFDPDSAGRIAMAIGVGSRLAREFPEADVRIPIGGPMAIASSLMGFEPLLCELLVDPDHGAAALLHLADGQVGFCRAIQRAGLDIAFFESAACPPLLSPAMFRRLELPALKRLLGRCAEVLGHPVPCIIGGDTTPILDAMLETGTGYVVCPIETDQEAFLRKVWDRTDVRVRVNIWHMLMARGTRQEIRGDVERVFRLTAGRPNVCLGTGALPYETPPENVLFVKELCRAHAEQTAG